MDRMVKQTMDSLMHGHVGGPANKNLQLREPKCLVIRTASNITHSLPTGGSWRRKSIARDGLLPKWTDAHSHV